MKRMISLILACLLALSLAAWANTGTLPDPAAAVATEAPANPTAEPTQAPDATPDPNMAIVFNDDVLEAMIREAMGKPEGDILVSDAQGITQLELSMDGSDWTPPRIHNLDALKYFTNLNFLAMNWALQNDGKGVDLSPLSGLDSLEHLSICCNEIYDISPLSSLVNLRSLWIWGCRYISDISALSGMTEMTDLWIKGNSIEDITPLSNMKNLNLLYMEQNLVTDLSPLTGLTKLTSLLLSDNPIKDYSVLGGIYPNLVEKDFEPVAAPMPIDFKDAVLEQKIRLALNIPDGDITLAQTESVTKLFIGNEWQEVIPDEIKVRNSNALKYFPNVTKLDIHNNGIEEIDSLRIMRNLSYLDASNNPIRDLRPLLYCPNLKYLNLGGSQCSSDQLFPLASLTKLESLDLSSIANLHDDVDAIAGLTNLKALYLQNLPIDFTSLAGLTNLTTLYLAGPMGDGLYTPDYSPLKDMYPNLTDKNFEMP